MRIWLLQQFPRLSWRAWKQSAKMRDTLSARHDSDDNPENLGWRANCEDPRRGGTRFFRLHWYGRVCGSQKYDSVILAAILCRCTFYSVCVCLSAQIWLIGLTLFKVYAAVSMEAASIKCMGGFIQDRKIKIKIKYYY
jgi:hypothetical protein